MAAVAPVGRRLVAVRLDRIPIEYRLRAVDVLVRALDDPIEMMEVAAAAHQPSGRTYMVSAKAYAERAKWDDDRQG